MSHTKLNELIKISEFYNPQEKAEAPFKLYGLVQDTLAFKGVNYRRHTDLLNELYVKNRKVKDTISKKNFVDYIISQVRSRKLTGEYFTNNDYQEIIESITLKDNNKYRIIKEIRGISLNNSSTAPKFGPFTVFYWQSKKGAIEKRYPQNAETIWMGHKHDYVIQTFVFAGDQEKAIEKAIDMFYMFENIIHVLIGNPNRKYYVSVTDRKLARYDRTYFFNEADKTIGSSNALKDYVENVSLDDEFFKNVFVKRIFKYFFNGNANDLQVRLSKAFIWLGQAFKERNYVDGFLKAMISLEILLQENVKGIITPSIMYQITELIAMVLGKTLESRVEIEHEIRNLYSRRSSIVHDGNENITDEEYTKMCLYARAFFFELLMNSRYKMTSLSELFQLIKTEKYSNCWKKRNI